VTLPPLSYAQRFEDFHLWRCLGETPNGFYIDIGAGHPVYDNVSFAFYLAGWRGISVEPNPALAALNRAVRRRDHLYQGLAGAAAGEATLYLQREFHGLSTTVAEHAQAAEKQVGASAEALTLPVTTLAALCERHALGAYEFLKVDVEGAEADVLRGADFSKARPKIIMVEAIKPFSLAPAWDEWEPMLAQAGYTYVWDDELNRYYVAQEARALADKLAAGPKWYADGPQIGNYKPAADDATHPDHGLARLLAGADMAKLPLTPQAELLNLLTAGVAPEALAGPATEAAIAAIASRLFGPGPHALPKRQDRESIRDAYARFIDSDRFRAACGRISASYAW
jgi:FkbM family methyltransferase